MHNLIGVKHVDMNSLILMNAQNVEAKTLLAQRMDATVNKVQAELEDKKSLFTTSKNDLELRIKLLQEQIQCLDELIKADETLWA